MFGDSSFLVILRLGSFSEWKDVVTPQSTAPDSFLYCSAIPTVVDGHKETQWERGAIDFESWKLAGLSLAACLYGPSDKNCSLCRSDV